MRYLLLITSLTLSANLPAAEIRNGRCVPETTEEVVKLFRDKQCGEYRTGLQAKGLTGKGATIESDRGLVRFDFASTQIKPEFLAILNQWGAALQQLGDMRFRLEGHADMIGEENDNYNLSIQRAEKLKDYFVQNFAVDASRFEIEGFGESKPLEGLPASPDEAQRQWNRRVELVKISGKN